MGRGLERRRIFASDADKLDFITRLDSGLAQTGIQCLAWAMMSNHYHLLLRVGVTPLPDLMRKLLGGYATAYNRRHHRVGYVFQNRYKSILCNEESYLLELVRYIHLNPVRAKIIDSLLTLDRYQWTGHAVLMGYREHDWQEIGDVLAHFGKQTGSPRREYRAFIGRGISEPTKVDYSGGGLIRSYGGWEHLNRARKEHERKIGGERIPGDSEFVEQAPKQDLLQLEAQTRLIRDGWDFEELMTAVCAFFQVDPLRVVEKARGNALSAAKSFICYFGTKKLKLSATEIGIKLKMGQSAVSMSSCRGRVFCEEHKFALEDLAQYRD